MSLFLSNHKHEFGHFAQHVEQQLGCSHMGVSLELRRTFVDSRHAVAQIRAVEFRLFLKSNESER